MIIQLVAFNVSSTWKKRLEMTTEIFNNSNADLILFSGHTLLNLKYVRALKKSITNNHTRAILEIKDYERNSFMELSNSLFYIHDGIIEDMFSSQIFASSKEIKNDSMLAERLLKEMPERRKIIIDGIRFSILQCGEINIIANRQKAKINLTSALRMNLIWHQCLMRSKRQQMFSSILFIHQWGISIR